MAEIVLQAASVHALVRQLEAAGMSEHVGMHAERHLRSLPKARDHMSEAHGAHWCPRSLMNTFVFFLSSIGCVLCLWLPHGQNDPSPPMCQYLTDRFRSHTAMHGE